VQIATHVDEHMVKLMQHAPRTPQHPDDVSGIEGTAP
jgi:hypothetical protein